MDREELRRLAEGGRYSYNELSDSRALAEGVLALLDELAARDAAINDLATYAGTKCDTYTGPRYCLLNGRTVDARYEADRACWPCTIRDTIRRALSVLDSEETQ